MGLTRQECYTNNNNKQHNDNNNVVIIDKCFSFIIMNHYILNSFSHKQNLIMQTDMKLLNRSPNVRGYEKQQQSSE